MIRRPHLALAARPALDGGAKVVTSWRRAVAEHVPVGALVVAVLAVGDVIGWLIALGLPWWPFVLGVAVGTTAATGGRSLVHRRRSRNREQSR